MPADLEGAVRFVTARGGPAEQARLAALLEGAPVPGVALDAGFARAPTAAGRPSGQRTTVPSTRPVFGWRRPTRWAPGPPTPRVAAALRFLAARQHADGRWEEAPTVAALAPPWAAPGDPAATLYLTANCGFWLAVWRRGDAAAVRAGEFLRAALQPDGTLPTFLQGQWLAAGLWDALGDATPAGKVLAALAPQLDGETPAGSLAWLITALARVGVPADHPLQQQAATLLAAAQQPDGRWISEDGPARDAHATVEAIAALQACGRI